MNSFFVVNVSDLKGYEGGGRLSFTFNELAWVAEVLSITGNDFSLEIYIGSIKGVGHRGQWPNERDLVKLKNTFKDVDFRMRETVLTCEPAHLYGPIFSLGQQI